jgi:purine-binding chemotaxis protein CheW
MTKKRIRYSDLGEAVAPPPPSKAAPVVTPAPEPEAIVAPAPEAKPAAAVEPEAVMAPELVVAPVLKPKRNSTPVELAKALAAEHAHDAPAAPATSNLAEVLVFRIGAERFAVDLMAVDEVIDLPVIYHVPEMPPAMVGVVTVRGTLTPVYSPHASLGIPLAQSEALLIFRRMGARVGVLIDDVEDAVAVDLRELRGAPATDGDNTLVLGVVRHEGALLAIVDADALIAACQIAALLETA